MHKVSFNNRNKEFFDTVQARVEDYFQKNHLKKTGNFQLKLKLFILVPLMVILYTIILVAGLPTWACMILGAILGTTMAGIGFNVMHDAIHGSYSPNKKINKLLGLSLNMLGGNAFLWKTKHNVIHHTYTNIDGLDEDIYKIPVIRQCKSQPWYGIHRFQHLYIMFVYSIASIMWIFVMDFTKYFSKKVYHVKLPKITTEEHIVFWVTKIYYVLLFIALPIVLFGWVKWLLIFLSIQMFMGMVLGIVFQLAHVVEQTQFVDGNSLDVKINEEWAIHQVKTTADFAPKNKWVTWFVGGLNFQVEHHLFPRISHVHYPAIQPLVMKTCADFNIKYNIYPTMMGAVISHFRFMKWLGQNP